MFAAECQRNHRLFCSRTATVRHRRPGSIARASAVWQRSDSIKSRRAAAEPDNTQLKRTPLSAIIRIPLHCAALFFTRVSLLRSDFIFENYSFKSSNSVNAHNAVAWAEENATNYLLFFLFCEWLSRGDVLHESRRVGFRFSPRPRRTSFRLGRKLRSHRRQNLINIICVCVFPLSLSSPIPIRLHSVSLLPGVGTHNRR